MSDLKRINKIAKKYGVMLASGGDDFYVWVAAEEDSSLQKSKAYFVKPTLKTLAEDLKIIVGDLNSGNNKIYDELEED